MHALTDKIYQILTKRKYRRSEPYLPAQLKQTIDVSIQQDQPVKVVGFWGVGPKREANWADAAACQLLSRLNDEVKSVHPAGIEFTYIFATLHGVYNGYDRRLIEQYVEVVGAIFLSCGFRSVYLDNLWQKYDISFEKIDDIYHSQPDDWWEKVEHREYLERAAQKRNSWLPPATAAQKYFIMRQLEKDMLQTEFHGSIFQAFSLPKITNVLPDMPTLYHYAIKRGRSDVPWFVVND